VPWPWAGLLPLLCLLLLLLLQEAVLLRLQRPMLQPLLRLRLLQRQLPPQPVLLHL
jgi:hypothetical protein